GVVGDHPSGAAAAPVLALGFEWTIPATSGHLRFFAQAVDVGNVASVHFADSSSDRLTKVEADPNIGLPELFAPAGYLLYAPVKAPFVIGVGGDYVPNLRKTPQDGVKHSVFHIGAMLSVDVPILELCHQ